ncbi:MAG: AAA family ATPase [Bacilli bacterium]|nr:AAA family ATPase [Bacilli bacterium]
MELRRAKIISITSSKGGIGKSIFLTNLAGIYETLGKKVLLVDLDLYNGVISTILNIHQDKTIYNFLEDLANNRFVDAKDYLYKYSDYIDVLPTCKDQRQGNKISPRFVEKVIYSFINNYDVILIDNSHVPTPASLIAHDLSNIILYMISNDSLDIANSREILNIYNNLGRDNVRVILNNSFRAKEYFFSIKDISDVINRKIDFVIKDSLYIRNIDKYIMDGKILVLNKKIGFINSKDQKWFIDIANKLCEVVSDGEEKEQ